MRRWGAEIGVRYGVLSEALLKANPSLCLFLVDPYLPYTDGEKEYTPIMQATIKVNAMTRLADFKDRTIWLQQPSVTAAAAIRDNALDFVFIDADHSCEAVKADLEAWYPKVKRPGGLFSGHDFMQNDGVHKAVTEFCEARDLNLFVPDYKADIWMVRLR